jgi:hypothetical protein
LNPDHESREIQETQNLLRHLEAASRSVEKKINRLSRGRVDANEIYRRIKEQNLLREEEEARAAKDQKQFAQFELSLGADKRTDEQVRRAYAESRKQASSTGSSAPETGGIP